MSGNVIQTSCKCSLVSCSFAVKYMFIYIYICVLLGLSKLMSDWDLCISAISWIISCFVPASLNIFPKKVIIAISALYSYISKTFTYSSNLAKLKHKTLMKSQELMETQRKIKYAHRCVLAIVNNYWTTGLGNASCWICKQSDWIFSFPALVIKSEICYIEIRLHIQQPTYMRKTDKIQYRIFNSTTTWIETKLASSVVTSFFHTHKMYLKCTSEEYLFLYVGTLSCCINQQVLELGNWIWLIGWF